MPLRCQEECNDLTAVIADAAKLDLLPTVEAVLPSLAASTAGNALLRWASVQADAISFFRGRRPLTIEKSTSLDAAGRSQLERFSGPLGRGAGHAFIFLGILFVVVATFRFVRTARLLDDQEMHSPSGRRRSRLVGTAGIASCGAQHVPVV
jgi:hypothetical protein